MFVTLRAVCMCVMCVGTVPALARTSPCQGAQHLPHARAHKAQLQAGARKVKNEHGGELYAYKMKDIQNLPMTSCHYVESVLAS